MRKLSSYLLVPVLFFLYPAKNYSQTVTNYVFSPSSTVFTALIGSTPAVITGGADEGYMSAVPIGFDFIYNSQAYSTLSISTNGYVSLGQNITALNSFLNNLSAGTNPLSPRPILAPLWDDLAFAATTNISYLVSGTAPYRIFTVQWLNAKWVYNAAAAGISFQLKLYEYDSKLEFIYRQEAGALLNPSASIGITNVASGAGNFLSLINTGTNPADTNSQVEANGLNTKPANGQVYGFVPNYIPPIAPAAINFSNIGATTFSVDWTDNTNTETYYEVYMSSDSINFNKVSTLYSTSISSSGSFYHYVPSGLNPSSYYYFKIYANNEGSLPNNFAYGFTSTSAGLLSGIKTICPSGCDYTSVANANIDIRNKGVSGSLILEFDSSYRANVETYPIDFGNLNTSAINTVTFRPNSNVVSLINFVSSAGITFDLNTTDYLTIDGKAGGYGSENLIQISNTNSVGSAIRFLNDATNNTLFNCKISGASTATNAGVISFMGSSGSMGNSNNFIFYCIIKDTVNLPIYSIYSNGSASAPNLFNSVYGNDLLNYFSSANTSYGIYLNGANNAWFIGSNNFYQTAVRMLSNNNSGAIGINSGSNYTLYGNYIGGSQAMCGGNASAYNGSGSVSFLNLNLANTATCLVQANVFQNINLDLNSSANAIIYLANGDFNINGNTIGSDGETRNIIYKTNAANGLFSPIYLSGGTAYGTVEISNNTIGGISIEGTGTTQFKGINIASTLPELIISDNLIGSLSTTNSICDSSAQSIIGISVTPGSPTNTITGNNIANLSSPNTSSTSKINGIYLNATGTVTLSGNNIFNLSYAGSSVLSGINAPLIGILHNASGLNQTCANNTVFGLFAYNTTLATAATGIYYAGTSSGSNVLATNFVHGISSNSTGPSIINGIYNGSSGVSAYNNRVRLGIDTIGASIDANHNFIGINDAGNSNSYYHNSVQIGGTVMNAGFNNSYAFYNSIGSTGNRVVVNNIFSNTRSNTLGSGKNYATFLSTGTLTGLNMNYNIYYAPGIGGVIGRYGATDYLVMNNWRTATFSDYNSGLGNPNFVSPNSGSASLNLKVQSPTPAEAAGSTSNTVIEDYEGSNRTSNTPVDIGADAGNYTGVDLFPPTITYTPFNNTTSTSNRTLSVRITDVGTGLRNAAGLQPRIWYRRILPIATTWFSTTGVLTSGTVMNGTWNFVIDYLSTGPALLGQQFQYYIVAQDSAPITNISYNPFPGANHSTVNTQVTAPNAPFSYAIVNALPTAILVGAGQTYTSLTGAGGLFTSINNSTLAANTEATIVSDITEPGTFALSNAGMGVFNLTIKPDNSLRTLSGTLVVGGNSLITLNGAKGVIIDGGPSKNLIIRNKIGTTPSITTAPALQLLNTNNDTIRNCILESNAASASYATLVLNTNTITASSAGNQISNCFIRPADNNNANSPSTAVLINAAAGNISNTSLVSNTINDFVNYGIYIANAGTAIFIGDPIDSTKGNSIYQTTPRALHYNILIGSGSGHVLANNSIYSSPGLIHTGAIYGIYIYNSLNNITLQNNYIGGCNKLRGLAPFVNAAAFMGIYFGGGSNSTSYLRNNQIGNISLNNNSNFTGIYVASGNVNLDKNSIGGAAYSMNAYDTIGTLGSFYGIRNLSASNLSFTNNLVSNIVNYGTGFCVGISIEAGVSTVLGNTIRDIRSYNTIYTNPDYSCNGIRFAANSAGNNIENNLVFNLKNLSNSSSVCVSGITVTSPLSNSTIHRNRIYNLFAEGTAIGGNSPIIRGIYVSAAGNASYANNQISILSSVIGSQPRIRGIEVNTGGGLNSFYHNSIYIGGTASNANNSSAFFRNTTIATASVLLKNNIFFNERNAPGTQYALSSNFNTNIINDFNLFVSPLATACIEYPLGTPKTITSWNSISGNPINNLYNTASQLTSTLFFPLLMNGNLSTNACRVSNNGAYTPIDYDYNNAIRSMTPDIGSVEFSTATGAASITSQPNPVTINCGPANAQFTINTSGYGNVFQWEENRGLGWNPLSNNAIYAGVKTNQLSITNAGASMNNYQYRCTFTGACLPAVVSNIVALSVSNTNTWTGANNTNWGNALNWSCGIIPTANTDVQINIVPNLPIISDGGRLCNNLNIANGASLTINNVASALSIYGQVNLLGSLLHTNGLITFAGNSQQIIPGITFANLTLNNTNGAKLGANTSIAGALNLTNGILDIGAYNLTLLGSGSTIIGSSNAKYIATTGLGTLNIQNLGTGGRTTSVLFPVGSSSNSYTPASITNLGALDEFKVRVMSGVNLIYNALFVPSGTAINSNAVNLSWAINETVTGGSNASISLQWNIQDELSGFTRSACYMARYTGSAWTPGTSAAAAGINPYTKTISSLANFSLFGVGSNGALPVSLLNFSAYKFEDNAQLNWRTASEYNSLKFEIERSFDATHFETIGTLKAAGNSETTKNYQYQDLGVFALGLTTIYYRLKVIDRDGAFEYAKTIKLTKETSKNEEIKFFPNPFNEELAIELFSIIEQNAKLSVFSMSGEQLFTGNIFLTEGINNYKIVDPNFDYHTNKINATNVLFLAINPGVYFVSLETATHKNVYKIIKR